ncbi:MAG: DNA polymerase III subunit alpha [Patescibacteria group bacterium UBA2163]
MELTHLSVHSHYSLLNGLPQIDVLVTQAKKDGMNALALTDRNNLYGAIEFYKTCTKNDIKPIIGVDLDIDLGVRTRLILLAENNTGYQNLLPLVSDAHIAHKGDPHATRESLMQYSEGLIVLIPGDAFAAGGITLAKAVQEIFPKEAIYARAEWSSSESERAQHRALAIEAGIPFIASDDIFYINSEDSNAREIVRKIADPGAEPDPKDRTFIDLKTFKERYREQPDALENIHTVIERTSVTLELGSWTFPDFPIPKDTTYEDELRRATEEGLVERGMEKTKEVEERLEYELSVINTKGFAPYFLAVADLLNFAKEHDILTTTRGSAAGSLVSYLTGITNIDPIKYKLPFERFLNPERPKAPDIDMDFADSKRDQVIEYARQKYGIESVAQIGTFGTLMARAAVRDVARALGYPYGVGDRIAKLIPFGSQGFPMTIEKALEIEEDLRRLYQSDEDVEIIINTARKVEGNARHMGVHAAGVVIAAGPATAFTPLQWDPHGESIVTQYDMHAVEDAGLLKFDFLGLKNLSVLGDAIERVRTRKKEEVDIENIPLDDPAVFAILARGETEGVFQLGGAGMTRYLKELAPTSIDDINAMVALYRPGPMESIPQYIARKRNPELITYPDQRLEKILDRSYGIITYQDDVLLTAITLAGYTWLEADILRKAMGKKIPAEMEAQKEKFIDGCVDYGKLSVAKAESIWKLIEPFAAYGFNKAHAASYGMVAYQTAYMKAHHTADYMASLMSADSGNTEKIAIHVAECVRLGIDVLPPDVNECFIDFTVVDEKTIRFGLGSIKNFGGVAAKAIIEERTANGPFTGVGDFAFRMDSGSVNKRGIEALIKAGAFDRFGDRTDMIAHMDEILAAQSRKSTAPENQAALFTFEAKAPEISIKTTDETSLADKLEWEKSLLGIYVSGHPVDRFKEELAAYPDSIANAIADERKGFPQIIGGVIDTAKLILTKKGDRMGFFTISDRTHSIEAVVFPKTYQEVKDILTEGTCILAKGKISYRNDEPSLLIDKVKKLG